MYEKKVKNSFVARWVNPIVTDRVLSACSITCVDPERFLRGGPTLTTFLSICFLVDEGGSKYHYKLPTLNAGLVAL